MSVFELALLIGCVVAALVNRGEPRVLLWIGAGIADYVASSIYYAGGWPYHPFATALMDAAVCLSIYAFAATRWELLLFNVFQGSVLVSILMLANLVPDAYAYALLLELCNWAALLVMIGTGVLKAIGNARLSGWLVGPPLRRAVRYVREDRPEAPFHKVWK